MSRRLQMRRRPVADAARPLDLAAVQRQADEVLLRGLGTQAFTLDVDGQRWHDLRPLLDPHEVPPYSIDLTRAVVGDAIERGLLLLAGRQPHLVRPAWRPA